MRGKGKRKTQGGGGEGVRKEQEIERAPEEVRILAELMLSESTRSGRKRTEP